MATSQRVQRILSEVRELTDEEKRELETELLAEDAAAEQAWGAEVDRRAARVLSGEASGLRREEVRALFAMSPADARARLAALPGEPLQGAIARRQRGSPWATASRWARAPRP
jgi:hypothetical protein